MTLTIDLTPAEQERVAVAAQQKGMQPAELVKKLLAEHLFDLTANVHSAPAETNVEERIRAMDAFAERNRLLPVLSDAAFDRESLYEDRL